MMKRMMHPSHGYGFAGNTIEEKTMRGNGWVDDDGKALAAKVAAANPVAEPEPDPLIVDLDETADEAPAKHSKHRK